MAARTASLVSMKQIFDVKSLQNSPFASESGILQMMYFCTSLNMGTWRATCEKQNHPVRHLQMGE
jgi:hypothetical protein